MKTIEIGIDLGTTNSAVAVVKSNEIEIIKNPHGEETTPSVIFADKNGNLLVGSKAKKKAADDTNLSSAQNWRAETKRLMGTNETVVLPNHGKALSAEEISAEILKSLIADVSRRHSSINTTAAVITVPAHFSTLQSEATKRAGQLANIDHVVLLQEPIAAAIAYGFTSKMDENWLVYDLGGGTFDVALVASRGGSLTVLAHGGDNFLGGKDIDASIVDHFIVPALKSKGHDYNYLGDINLHKKLRIFAEQGKIDLSTAESVSVEVELQIGESKISESLDFSRSDLLNACKSILNKTLNICQETIRESHVDSKSIKRIVLVGGPTQMPVLRSFLESELGIKVDGSQDPLTVVARGAALFAQQVPISNDVVAKDAGSSDSDFLLEINFSPISSEDQQTVTGKIKKSPNNLSMQAHTICFQAEDKSFDSGDLILKNEKFILQLPTGVRSTQFWIYLKDNKGNLLSCVPDSLSISRGVSISGAPLPHSIGVSILSLNASKGFTEVDEVMDIFFQRNSILPVSATKRFYTVTDLKSSETENALPVRIYEGESLTPNRNTLICDLAITGKMVPSSLKKGSPVDITLSVDESRQLSVKAYLPEIDLTLDARATIYDEDISVNDLKESLREQSKRNDVIQNDTPSSKDKMDDLISDIGATLDKSTADTDQKRKAAKQLKDLMVAIDDAEARATFDRNVSSFLKLSEEVQGYILEANPKEKRNEYTTTFSALKQEGMRAIDGKDAIILKQTIEKMHRIHIGWTFNDPAVLVAYMKGAKNAREDFEDKETLDKLLLACEAAIQNDSVEQLRESVLSILDLAHTTKAGSQVKTLKSGITR